MNICRARPGSRGGWRFAPATSGPGRTSPRLTAYWRPSCESVGNWRGACATKVKPVTLSVEFKVNQVESNEHSPHGIKCSVSLHDKYNTRILGFDNARL